MISKTYMTWKEVERENNAVRLAYSSGVWSCPCPRCEYRAPLSNSTAIETHIRNGACGVLIIALGLPETLRHLREG